MRETIKHGEVGCLVSTPDEFTEAVKAAYQPGAITDVMRARCREWVSRFSVENMAKAYNELIHEAVSTGGW